jgi:signal transduction histidine kinase
MASSTSLDLRLRATAWPGLAPAAARALQAGWLILQLGALAVAIVATPALHARYQTTCPEALCDILPQPNAISVDLLARLGVPLRDYASVMVGVEWLALLVWGVLGALIVWKRPRDLVGLLLAYGGVVGASKAFLDALGDSHPDVVLPARIGLLVTAVVVPLLFALFPDGQWVPSWTRWVALAAIGYGVAVELAGAPLPTLLAALEIPLGVAPLAVLLGAQVYRYRRVSDVVQRQQAKWFLFAIGLFVSNVAAASVAFVLGVAAPFQFVFLVLCYGVFVTMGLAVTFAILRYRLFDIDVILNRALVYGALTVAVVAIYALVVSGLGAIVRSREEPAVAVVATGVIAVLFAPLRDRLQRGANRLLYGDRDDPYAVIARLGRRLEGSLAPEAVLPTIVETVASALKLPYAAIALQDGDESIVAAAYGAAVAAPLVTLPLTYHGERVGELRLAPRAGEHELTVADRLLLDDLAPQAGIAVHAVRLTHALQQARERLVTAREEERRRLRRDLHDGLGPLLGSQGLMIDAARALMRSDPTAAESLLLDLKAQGQVAIADIRRLVYALRPPTLDDSGLVAAVRQEADQCQRAGIHVVVVAPRELPPLPAAVEVAAYRIAQEALTNVMRHARARTCTVTVALAAEQRALLLEIADDGRGLPPECHAGVGTTSMRERAEELGGTCLIAPRPGGGTLVSARLPLPREGQPS